MGKRVGIVVVTLGAFLLAIALLSRFYVYDRIALAPLGQAATTISETAPGNDAEYLDIDAGMTVVEGPLRSVRETNGDVELAEEASSDFNADMAVWHTYVCTDTPDFDCASSETPLSATEDTVAFDRTTGETVNWSGATHSTGGSTVRGPFQGVYLKFPFDTQQQDYEFWDGTLKESVTAEFVTETEIDGLAVYEFSQTIEPTPVGTIAIPGSLFGDQRPSVVADRVYSNERTIHVEPVTGAIIKGSESQNSYLEVDGVRVVTTTEAELTYTDETVAAAIDRSANSATVLNAVKSTIPLVGSIVGLGLLILGAFLLFRNQNSQPVQTGSAGRKHEPAHA